MTVVGDLTPKRPQHYRRHDWIGSAIRKKMATWASLAQRCRSRHSLVLLLAASSVAA
jgi:hypothetical protein